MAVGFGTDKFRDVFSEISTGILPSLYAAGSASGSPISMTNFGKVVFHLYTGSGSANATYQLAIAAASASGGTFTAITSLGTIISASTATGSNNVAVIEIRGEALTNLQSNYTWVKPVLVVANGSTNAAVTAHGFVVDYAPASGYDSPSTFTNQEVNLF